VQIQKAQKNTDDVTVFFALLGSAHLKVACKMLVNVTLGFIAFFRCLGLLKLEFAERLANSRIKIVTIIAGLWLFVTLFHLPAACFGVSHSINFKAAGYKN